jgi:hypothetical protein
VLALNAGLLVAGPVTTAFASQGSVPSVVSDYAANPQGLLARLADLFGPGKGGTGIAFDDTAKVGQLNRAYAFTNDFAQEKTNENPIRLTNEWTAPISVADSPVGLATIWINPQTDDPELAGFVADPVAGKALADVPAAGYLIHDEPRQAWLTLDADVLTALVPGSTGLTGPTTAIEYRTRVLSADATGTAVVAPPTGQGAINSIVIVSVALLVTAAILLAPGWRRRRKAAASANPDGGAPEASAADAADAAATPPADPPGPTPPDGDA